MRSLASSSSSSPAAPPEWARKPPQPDDPTNPSSQPYLDPSIQIPRPQRPASEPTDQKRARLLWASRKRGILESDLLMSTFAAEYLADMTRAELDEYDQFLEENDWDIYYWVTGAKGKIVPERVSGISIWPKLVEHALNTQRKILRMPDLQRLNKSE
ncbi:succinate dehydrogenase assembly factor 2 [Geranomyces michiganensis]|nr:succinate dehydrogenase assembly factor 2 [Geranomyces michiganensis]